MAVGFEYGLLSDSNVTATSSLHDTLPWKARLAGEEAWCPQTNSSMEYLEVALDSLHRICALATQGLHAIGAYTTTYRLQLSIDGLNWEYYNNGSSEVEITSNMKRQFPVQAETLGSGSSFRKISNEWLDANNKLQNKLQNNVPSPKQ